LSDEKKEHELDCDRDRDRDDHNSLDSLCRALKRFVGQNVTLTLRSGDTVEGILIRVRRGIVKLTETVMVSPFMESQLTFTRCSDIESFTVVAPSISL
jgi:hypothetical protein